jgi:hypothetical protein
MMSAAEWEVWLVDGTRLNSAEHEWPAGARGVLVVRAWGGPFGDTVSWGEAYYGRPDTWAMEGRVSDEEFRRVLAEAQATLLPPSGR